jgi:hypothetical protein
MAYETPTDGSNNAVYEGYLFVDAENWVIVQFQLTRGNTNGIPDEAGMDSIFQELVNYLEDAPFADRPIYNDGQLKRGRAVSASKHWDTNQNVTSHVEIEVIEPEA